MRAPQEFLDELRTRINEKTGRTPEELETYDIHLMPGSNPVPYDDALVEHIVTRGGVRSHIKTPIEYISNPKANVIRLHFKKGDTQ